MNPRRPFPRTVVLLLSLVATSGCLATDAAVDPDGSRVVEELFEAQRSDIVVEVQGVVQRTLADDTQGSRHQRFILRLSTGRTLLIAHNIDLAARVPLDAGDAVSVRGEYEWNDQGGVLHWTHHDPAGDRLGGWIEHEDRRYR